MPLLSPRYFQRSNKISHLLGFLPMRDPGLQILYLFLFFGDLLGQFFSLAFLHREFDPPLLFQF